MAWDELTIIKTKLMMQFYNIAKLGSQSIEKSNYFSLTFENVHILIEDMHEKDYKGETCQV